MLDNQGKELAGYCGLYCGACSMKNGQIRNTASMLKQLLDTYKYSEWAPLVAEIFPATKHYPEFDGVLDWLTTWDCEACQEGGGPPQCAIRLCAREKGFSGCWECSQSTCDKLAGIDQSTPVAAENRQSIRATGLQAWLEQQAGQAAGGFSYFEDLHRKQ